MKNMRAKLAWCKASPVILLAVFVLVAAILSGCTNPFNRPDRPEMGTFVLSIGERVASRIIAPVWPETGLQFDLYFEHAVHENEKRVNWRGAPVNLLPGDWTLTVTAFHVEETDGGEIPRRKIALGELPVRIAPGITVGDTVYLESVLDAGPGTFVWDISAPPGTAMHLLVAPILGGPQVPVDAAGTSGSLTLPPDVYNVVFTLTVPGKRESAVIREVLRIYSNMTSEFALTLDDMHFPQTLLDIILDAWDNHKVAKGDGTVPGSVQKYLIEERGLRAGHFGLLEIDGLGAVDGFDESDFPSFLGWFDTLPGPKPGNLGELKILADAALIGLGGYPFALAPGKSWANAEAEVFDRLSANNTPVRLLRTTGGSTSAIVGFGEHVYRVPISFNDRVYDHTVRFLSGDETLRTEQVYSGYLLTLTPPRGAGFVGWTCVEGKIYAVNSLLVVAENLDLHALWVDPEYAVKVETSGPARVHRTETPAFTAKLVAPLGHAASKDFTWRLVGNVSPGTGISNDPDSRGTITFAPTQTPGTIRVVADSAYSDSDGTPYSGYFDLEVLPPTVTGVTLIPVGEARAMRGETVSFALSITGVGNPELDAEVVWEPVPTGLPGDPEILVAATAATTAVGDRAGGTLAIAASPGQALGIINARARVGNWAATPDGGSNWGIHPVAILPPTGLSVTVSPGPIHFMNRTNHLFSALVDSTAGHASGDVVWSIERIGGGYERRPATNITGEGRLVVSGRQRGDYLVLRASSVYDAGVFDEVTVRFKDEPAIGRWRVVRVGIDHTMAITWEGELYVWGRNQHGQLGLGHTNNVSVPTRLGTRSDWIDVAGGWAHTVALAADRTIWGAGEVFSSGHGPGGTRVLTYGSELVRIGDDNDWQGITATHSAIFGIREDGTLWSWGSDASRMLGHGGSGTSHSADPGPVFGGRSDWAFVTGSRNHAVALTREGQLFGWGSNNNGQLGRPASTSPVSRPTTMGSVGDGMRWHTVAVGNNFSAGIRRDGAAAGGLYLWGLNEEAVLGVTSDPAVGTGAAARRDNPVRLGNDTWLSLNLNSTSFVLAIRSDNTLWSWGGADLHGQLGRGGFLPFGFIGVGQANVTARRTVAQITEGRAGPGVPGANPGGLWNVEVDLSGRTWVNSIAGGSFGFAIDSDGELWGWGHNSYGMLGFGIVGGNPNTNANRNRPVQVQPDWVAPQDRRR